MFISMVYIYVNNYYKRLGKYQSIQKNNESVSKISNSSTIIEIIEEKLSSIKDNKCETFQKISESLIITLFKRLLDNEGIQKANQLKYELKITSTIFQNMINEVNNKKHCNINRNISLKI